MLRSKGHSACIVVRLEWSFGSIRHAARSLLRFDSWLEVYFSLNRRPAREAIRLKSSSDSIRYSARSALQLASSSGTIHYSLPFVSPRPSFRSIFSSSSFTESGSLAPRLFHSPSRAAMSPASFSFSSSAPSSTPDGSNHTYVPSGPLRKNGRRQWSGYSYGCSANRMASTSSDSSGMS